jgi:hypothetical protein
MTLAAGRVTCAGESTVGESPVGESPLGESAFGESTLVESAARASVQARAGGTGLCVREAMRGSRRSILRPPREVVFTIRDALNLKDPMRMSAPLNSAGCRFISLLWFEVHSIDTCHTGGSVAGG